MEGGTNTFKCQDIPSNHPIFENPVMIIPVNLEIPLVIHRLGTQSSDRADLDCQIACYLNIDPTSGFAPDEWQSHVGSCTVARKDKKTLSSEHLEAVWMYVDHLIGYYEEDDAKGVGKLIKKKEFEEWFEEYKEDQTEDGRDWSDVGSIYDV